MINKFRKKLYHGHQSHTLLFAPCIEVCSVQTLFEFKNLGQFPIHPLTKLSVLLMFFQRNFMKAVVQFGLLPSNLVLTIIPVSMTMLLVGGSRSPASEKQKMEVLHPANSKLLGEDTHVLAARVLVRDNSLFNSALATVM